MSRVKKALESYDGLIEVIAKMTETELKEAIKLEQEREEGPRKVHLTRMHQRLKRLQTKREREKLLGTIGS